MTRRDLMLGALGVAVSGGVTAADAMPKNLAERLGRGASERLVMFHADDVGMCHSVNEATRRAILTRLARALRAERNRGRAGHWTYDLNRHIALKQAYAAERALMAK